VKPCLSLGSSVLIYDEKELLEINLLISSILLIFYTVYFL
jgi:hypothetical protein